MQQLMTEEIAKTVPRLYEQDGAEDPTVYAHYFSCVNGWDWWLLEFDGTDEAFGLVEGYDDALKQDAKDDMHWDAAQQPWDDVQMGVYTCKSCGGELVCDESTAATACPFCGNPIVLTGRLSGDLKPDYVIPFKLDKKAAEAALRNHMKGKRLLPNLFRSENRISEVKGVYVPFWLFDADADAHIRYHATRIRTWSDRDYDYTETQHYAILRSGDLSFTHVPVDGSSPSKTSI